GSYSWAYACEFRVSQGEPTLNPDQRTAHFDELNHLDAEIRRSTDVYTLRPIHERIEELSRLHASDPALMSAVNSLRATMVAHGQRLMSGGGAASAVTPPNTGSSPLQPP